MFRGLLALCRPWAAFLLALLGVGLHLADLPMVDAQPIADAAVYGFAQQKVYGMTLTATPGSSAAVIGSVFSVKLASSAAFDTVPGVVANAGGLDTLQSFITSGIPLAPPENYSGNANPGMSLPANERVLLQANPTGAGVAQGVDLTNPHTGSFFTGRNFARGDGYTTPNPDTTVAPPGPGTIPADAPPGTWPAGGSPVPGVHLFAPVGTADTLSIDLAAEALLNGEGYATIAIGASDWTASGSFSITGAADARAAVSLDFSLVERLVVYSWSPEDDVAIASNSFAFDVLDGAGESVFGPPGANPSTTRLLATGVVGAETYNNNTFVPTHIYPGPVVVNFQTMPLAPGSYSFILKGTTTANVTAAPEPAIGSGLVLLAAATVGRRFRFASRRSRRGKRPDQFSPA